MSIYFPEIAWSTIANNVIVGSSTYRYKITVNPLDPNEPGSSGLQMVVGDWFIDYAGYPFLIENISGYIITLYDVNERGNGISSAFGPYANKLGYIYRPKNGAFLLTQAQLRKLDPSAADIINPIEKGVSWLHRGVNFTSGVDSYLNITKINTGLNTTVSDYNPTGGWSGGGSITINSAGGGGGAVSEYLTRPITQVGHGFIKDFIYYDGLLWAKAKSDNINTGATHYAVRLTNDTFNLITVGEVNTSGMLDDLGNTLVAGDYYFLSQTIAGRVTGIKYTSGITQAVIKANELNQSSISIQEPYNITAGSDLILSNGILHWDGVNGKYEPYSSQIAGAFDSGVIAPFHTNRLNYDGYFYGTKLYSNNTEVSVSGHTHPYEPILGNPALNGYILSSTNAGVRSWIAAPTGISGLTNNILPKWNGTILIDSKFNDDGTTPKYISNTIYHAGNSNLSTVDWDTKNLNVAGTTKLGILTGYLKGTTGTVDAVTTIPESDILFTDITTGNVSTSKHGYFPKLPNDATKYWNGAGGWTTPVGGLIPYIPLTFGSTVTWNCAVSTNVTLTSTGNFTLVMSGLTNGMSGDLRLYVSSVTSITMPTSKLNGSVAELTAAVYHLCFVYDGVNLEFNLARYA